MEFIRRFVDLQAAGAIYRAVVAARWRLVPLQLGDAAVKGRSRGYFQRSRCRVRSRRRWMTRSSTRRRRTGSTEMRPATAAVLSSTAGAAWVRGPTAFSRPFVSKREVGACLASRSQLSSIASALGVWLAE